MNKKNAYYGVEDSRGLFHSDTYLGAEFDDGLQHWKYIKRYKTDGKWRYVYANKDLHNKINNNINQARNAAFNYNYSVNKENMYRKSLETQKRMGHPVEWQNETETQLKNQQMTTRQYEQQFNYYDSEAYKYIIENTPGSLASKKIKKGKEALSKLLSKITGKK